MNLPTTQVSIQLYSFMEETTQNSIIYRYSDFFDADPWQLLYMLKVLVTQKSNLMVHRILFLSIFQDENKSIQNFLIYLRSGAWDCNFMCLICKHDLSYMYIKDLFI